MAGDAGVDVGDVGGVVVDGSTPVEVLERLICQGAADLTAAERDWLLAVAEFDRREVHLSSPTPAARRSR